MPFRLILFSPIKCPDGSIPSLTQDFYQRIIATLYELVKGI